MPKIYQVVARGIFSDPFDALGARSGQNIVQTVAKNNNANSQQYPYPQVSMPIDRIQGTAVSTAQSSPSSMMSTSDIGATGIVIQSTQMESSEFSTSHSSMAISSSTTSSFTSRPSTSSVQRSSTSSGSTLRVFPPIRQPTIVSASVFRTLSATESFTTDAPDFTLESSRSSSIQLSPVAIGLIISVGGTVLLIISVCMIRCIRRQLRHKRRDRDAELEFAEKSLWDDAHGMSMERSPVDGSPSTMFGGKERTGLTPQPSWTTFYDAERAATASPYPLGLLPPPSTMQQVPPARVQGGQQAWHRGINHGRQIERGNIGSHQYPSIVRQFAPPTITITGSSPRQSSQHLAKRLPTLQDRIDTHPRESSSQSEISSGHSYNRVSVYTDPVHGARLMKPPRLLLVNNDPSLSESDGGPRNSGWSSWDDNVGVELGVMIDRKLAPRRKSRIPVSKARGSVSPLRVTLAPVEEVSDASEVEASKRSPKGAKPSSLHPHSPAQLRRGPASPTSLKRGLKITRGASPRTLKGAVTTKQAQPQRLYDLPQFEASSPGGNDSTRVASPSSAPASPIRQPTSEFNPSKRQSKRSSRRTSTTRPTAQARPSSTVSDLLSETYAYVYSYASSSTESEEIQVRHTSRRTSAQVPKGDKAGERLARVEPSGMASSPAVSDVVGTLMMKAYDEEGAIPSPSLPHLNEKKERGGGARARVHGGEMPVLGVSTRANVPMDSAGTGRVSLKQRQQQTIAPKPARQQHRTRRALTENQNTTYKRPTTSLLLSPLSVYSQHPDTSQAAQPRGVPSLPPPGMPNLHQIKLMREMPDYRSPTYSVYGMYRDETRASPLQDSPVEYRYASVERHDGDQSNQPWRSEVI